MVIALVLSLAFSSLDIVPSIGSAVGGGGLGLGLFLVIAIVSRGGMGMGDVKLAVISGGLVAVILLLTGKRGRRHAIPFCPYLSLAAIAALLYGQTIFDWYTGLF